MGERLEAFAFAGLDGSALDRMESKEDGQRGYWKDLHEILVAGGAAMA